MTYAPYIPALRLARDEDDRMGRRMRLRCKIHCAADRINGVVRCTCRSCPPESRAVACRSYEAQSGPLQPRLRRDRRLCERDRKRGRDMRRRRTGSQSSMIDWRACAPSVPSSHPRSRSCLLRRALAVVRTLHCRPTVWRRRVCSSSPLCSTKAGIGVSTYVQSARRSDPFHFSCIRLEERVGNRAVLRPTKMRRTRRDRGCFRLSTFYFFVSFLCWPMGCITCIDT